MNEYILKRLYVMLFASGMLFPILLFMPALMVFDFFSAALYGVVLGCSATIFIDTYQYAKLVLKTLKRNGGETRND